ncbi:MAG: kelch repeat-containing protein [Pseudomonadota bacterium]
MANISMTRRGILLTGTAAVSFGCSAAPNPASGASEIIESWRAGPALPIVVQEIYPTLHQGRIHLAGGFISDGASISGVTDRHIALDAVTGTWTDLPALPTPRHHPNLISFQSALLAIGGFQAQSEQAGWVMQSGVWRFDGDVWTDAPTLPQPNGESVTGVLNGHLHVCGGRAPVGATNRTWNDHSDIGDHFVLNELDGDWQRAAPLPTARNSAAAAVIGADWHIVGGRTVAGGNTPAHDVYDAQEDRWRTAAPMPQGQGGLAAASLGGRLYAFGGEYFEGGGGVYPEAWAYDPGTDAWTALPDMPHPRHGLGAVAVDDEIYVIGGALRVGGSETSNLVEIFRPAA